MIPGRANPSLPLDATQSCVRRWTRMDAWQRGLVLFACAAAGATGAQAQTTLSPSPAASPSRPLQFSFPKSAANKPPLQLAPGASWDRPALAPESHKPLGVAWSGSTQDWDISAAVTFVEETRLNAADFQTGGLFETEAAIVRRFGDFRVGAVGYSARSAGETVGRGPMLGQARWRGSAAGPVVGYDATIAGKPATMSLRWYREIGTPGENGDTVSAALAFRF